MLTLDYRRLAPFAYAYLGIPCVVFFLTFVRPLFGIPASLIMLVVFWRCVAGVRQNGLRGAHCKIAPHRRMQVDLKMLMLLGAAAMLWALLGGQGGWWYQSEDWAARNAILRDLITHPWPVTYEWKGTALAYYIGHWMVPGSVGRIAYLAAGLDVAWVVANTFLWLWTSAGLFLTALLLLVFIQPKGRPKQIAVLLFFIFFSGMDAVGAVIRDSLGYCLSPDILHLEWWIPFFQFSSMTTCLFWVFNQAVAAWLATVCFMHERTPANYAYIATCTLLCGPFPMLGLSCFMVGRFAIGLLGCIRSKTRCGRISATLAYLSQSITIQNLLTLLFISPVVILYLASNGAFSSGPSSSAEALGNGLGLSEILLFLMLDAGVYLALVFEEHRRDPLFYMVAALLALCPFIRIGNGYDFTMRASIPGLFILMVYCIQAVFAQDPDALGRDGGAASFRMRRMVLMLCLAIGCATPLLEFYRGFHRVESAGTNLLACDYTVSFETTSPSINFESFDYREQAFYRYLASE